jgi:hypothetical protein
MNQIVANVVEIEINESQASAAKQADELMMELTSSQLALIGGGTAIGILD